MKYIQYYTLNPVQITTANDKYILLNTTFIFHIEKYLNKNFQITKQFQINGFALISMFLCERIVQCTCV